MFARLALEGDEDACIELGRARYIEEEENRPFDAGRAKRTFQRYLETGQPVIFVVEHNREVIAFLMAAVYDFAASDGHFAKEEVIFIRPDKRGTRAAALLMDIFTQWADRIQAREAYMQLADNSKIQQNSKFLARWGFERISVVFRRVRRD